MPLTCLLVDDNADFLAAAVGLLRAEGVTVVGTARNSWEAHALASSAKPDVILVDVELGDEDGVAVAEDLAPATGGPAVILISSSHTPDELGELIESTAVRGFIAKDELNVDAISRLVG